MSSTGVGVTLIILAIIVIGGGGLSIAGYLVYKASQDRILAQEQRKVESMAADLEAQRLEKERAMTSPSLAIRREPTSQDIETLRRLGLTLTEASTGAEEDYNEDMERAGLKRLLTATRIAKDTSFEESRVIITELRRVMEIHQKEFNLPYLQFVKEVEEAEFQGVAKEELVANVRSSLPELENVWKQLWELEGRIIDQYEQAINHLEATRGTWKLEGDSLVFEQPKDAERYRLLFTEVDKHTQSQLKVSQQYIQAATERAQDILNP